MEERRAPTLKDLSAKLNAQGVKNNYIVLQRVCKRSYEQLQKGIAWNHGMIRCQKRNGMYSVDEQEIRRYLDYRKTVIQTRDSRYFQHNIQILAEATGITYREEPTPLLQQAFYQHVIRTIELLRSNEHIYTIMMELYDMNAATIPTLASVASKHHVSRENIRLYRVYALEALRKMSKGQP